MDKGTQQVIVLLTGGFIISVISHALAKNFWLACLSSATVASIGFCITAAVREGGAGKFFVTGVIFAWLYSFVVSAVTGLPFVLVRLIRRRKV